MFYSPKKDIERYVSFKNQQIKTLKQQLEQEKITQESIFIARKKLQKVKNQYNILISENHQQLIETLQKAQDKKKSLEEDLSLKRKQLDLKTSEKSELLNMKRQLLQKLQKARQVLDLEKSKRSQLTGQRKQVDDSVKKVISQNQKTRKQNEETSSLLTQAHNQLAQSKSKAKKSQERVQHLKEQMTKVGSFILVQKQKISSLKIQDKWQELKIENLQTKIKYLNQVKANLLASKDKINSNKLLLKERSELNRHQTVSSQMMNCLVKISDAMNENKLVEKQACEREIKETLVELQLSECTQKQLKDQLAKLQQKIQKVDQNSKSIMESLQNMEVQDSTLISIITGHASTKKDKKQDSKQNRKLFQNKQNVPLMEFSLKKSSWSKLNPLDLAKTSDDQSQMTTI